MEIEAGIGQSLRNSLSKVMTRSLHVMSVQFITLVFAYCQLLQSLLYVYATGENLNNSIA